MPRGSTTVRAAARARSVLAGASSARVTWLGAAAPEPHDVPTVVIDRPRTPTPGHRRPAVVEVADVAPLPVRERVRARVRLHGYADLERTPDGGDERLRISVQAVELEADGAVVVVPPEQLRAAAADPFATREGPVLSHLATGHPGLVEPAATPEDVRAGMQALARRAAAGTRRTTERSRRVMPEPFRSGPAAARICRAEPS